MKKILAFLLAVSMILAMAACAAAPAQTTTETAQTEQKIGRASCRERV